jgi:predicted double-glycine peptidase
MKALRDTHVVRQRYDYSCGAAALATLLRYGFGDPATERDVLKQLFDLLTDQEKIISRKEGFSLLDLQRVALSRRFKAAGFRIQPEDLDKISGPVLVYIEPRGYKHFAVLRGVMGGRAYLADPARGNIRMPLYAFVESWRQSDGRGIIFVVEPNSGAPAAASPLALTATRTSQPEIMTVREQVAVGGAVSLFHYFARQIPCRRGEGHPSSGSGWGP